MVISIFFENSRRYSQVKLQYMQYAVESRSTFYVVLDFCVVQCLEFLSIYIVILSGCYEIKFTNYFSTPYKSTSHYIFSEN